ncbi:hypothetical protein D3C75_801000 [compost metagenome]
MWCSLLSAINNLFGTEAQANQHPDQITLESGEPVVRYQTDHRPHPCCQRQPGIGLKAVSAGDSDYNLFNYSAKGAEEEQSAQDSEGKQQGDNTVIHVSVFAKLPAVADLCPLADTAYPLPDRICSYHRQHVLPQAQAFVVGMVFLNGGQCLHTGDQPFRTRQLRDDPEQCGSDEYQLEQRLPFALGGGGSNVYEQHDQHHQPG